MVTKTAVITGASSGIGAAIARRVGAEGWNLALAARRQKELELVAAQSGSHVLPIVADVTQRGDVERLLAKAVRTFGNIDVWINNAGRGVGKKVLDLTEPEFDEIVAVNLKSVFYGMQVAAPYFQLRGDADLPSDYLAVHFRRFLLQVGAESRLVFQLFHVIYADYPQSADLMLLFHRFSP